MGNDKGLTLRNGLPSHDTFNRLFAALDPKSFLDCFLRWTQSLRQAVPQEIVALDGKALRRALNADQSVKYVVSAWAESNGLVLGQLKVADKNNKEPRAKRVVLNQPPVRGQSPTPTGGWASHVIPGSMVIG